MTMTRRKFLASSTLIAISPSVNPMLNVAPKDTEILGRFTHRTASDISVEIVYPYQHLTGRSHIPYFARPWHSYDGQHGDDTARKLLSKVFEIGHHLEGHMTALRGTFFGNRYAGLDVCRQILCRQLPRQITC